MIQDRHPHWFYWPLCSRNRQAYTTPSQAHVSGLGPIYQDWAWVPALHLSSPVCWDWAPMPFCSPSVAHMAWSSPWSGYLAAGKQYHCYPTAKFSDLCRGPWAWLQSTGHEIWLTGWGGWASLFLRDIIQVTDLGKDKTWSPMKTEQASSLQYRATTKSVKCCLISVKL